MAIKIVPRGHLNVYQSTSDDNSVYFRHNWEIQQFYCYKTAQLSGCTVKQFLEHYTGRYSCYLQRSATQNTAVLTETTTNVIDFHIKNYIVSNSSILFPVTSSLVSGTSAQNAGLVYNAALVNPTSYDGATITFSRQASNVAMYWRIAQYGPTN